jgi:DNA-binding XRE family transcriptional regulator
MRTRIRELRKLRNLTLQQLADAIGTTAQTVQRLETDNMTVSLDWLEKIAAALNLSIASLLPGSRDLNGIEILGSIGSDCQVVAGQAGGSDGVLSLVVPAQLAVAVKLVAALGAFEVGTMLVGRRIDAPNFEGAHGRNCLIKTRSNNTILRKIAVEGKKIITSMPFDMRPGVQSDVDVDWIAPVFMAVRYV